jgi:hypothetical protein
LLSPTSSNSTSMMKASARVYPTYHSAATNHSPLKSRHGNTSRPTTPTSNHHQMPNI